MALAEAKVIKPEEALVPGWKIVRHLIDGFHAVDGAFERHFSVRARDHANKAFHLDM